ncbi:MAG: aspartate/glutamate racemase family protein, partial [Pseudomonadales bacterium]
MKTIGLLGGMSWESTVSYYQYINRAVGEQLGGLHSARILLASVDFHEVERMQRANDWHAAAQLLGDHATRLETAGADLIVLCTNTMHKIAADIEEKLGIPLIHIVDSTGRAMVDGGWTKVGLLGTRFTMQEDFYVGRLERNFGINVIVPDEYAQKDIHQIIYDELCLGVVSESARQRYVEIIGQLVAEGAGAVIMGCTEIGLLLRAGDVQVPLIDTTRLHAQEAVRI